MITLYLLANIAYLATLPFASIQNAPADRVATATLDAVWPGAGAVIMAVAIVISTFGCNNGLILAGARAYYAMARDGLLPPSFARVHPRYRTPHVTTILTGVFAESAWSGGPSGLIGGHPAQVLTQLASVLIVMAYNCRWRRARLDSSVGIDSQARLKSSSGWSDSRS